MNHVLAILGLGNQELFLIMLILLLLFGAAKLPKLARSMGSSVNEFKKGMAEGARPDPSDDAADDDAAAADDPVERAGKK